MDDIRNKLLLYGKYATDFNRVAFENGLLKPMPLNFKEYHQDMKGISEVVAYDLYQKKVNAEEILQMLLLFEDISIVNPDLYYDYSALTKTGFISIVEDPSFVGDANWRDISHEQLLQFKDVITSTLRLMPSFKDLHRQIGLDRKKVSYKKFVEILYDYYFLKRDENLITEQHIKIISQIEKSQTIGSEKHVKKMHEKHNYEYPDNYWEGLFAIIMSQYVGTLMKLLEMSSVNNSILMQKEFDFQKITNYKNIRTTNLRETLDSYKIVRLSYEKLITKLPKLESIEDVFRIKESKHKEIKRLREILFLIERSLKHGEQRAIKRANKEITKAVNDLNRGKRLSKVNRWISYLSLPIGIIEASFGMPPVMGILTGVSSSSTAYNANQMVKHNNWIQVVR